VPNQMCHDPTHRTVITTGTWFVEEWCSIAHSLPLHLGYLVYFVSVIGASRHSFSRKPRGEQLKLFQNREILMVRCYYNYMV